MSTSPSKSGEQLQTLRLRAQLSGRRLATLASMSQSKISKIERGHLLPSATDILQLAVAMRLSGDVTDRWLSLLSGDHDQRRQANDLTAYYLVEKLEQEARQVDSFLTNTLPALLQTPEYTAYYLGRNLSDDELQDVLHLRFKRQAQLFNRDVSFRFLIREQAFYTFHEATEMWRHQLDVLTSLLKVCRHSIRVLNDDDAVRLSMNDEIIIIDNKSAYYEVPIFKTIQYSGAEERLAIQAFSQGWSLGTVVTPDYLRTIALKQRNIVDLRPIPTTVSG